MDVSKVEVASTGPKKKNLSERESYVVASRIKLRRRACRSVCPESATTTFCSGNTSVIEVVISDLEVDDVGKETYGKEMEVQSEEQESTARIVEDRSTRVKIMVDDPELDELFTAVEKRLQKEFAEKYNYDIVKDEPLEGRYEWIRLK